MIEIKLDIEIGARHEVIKFGIRSTGLWIAGSRGPLRASEKGIQYSQSCLCFGKFFLVALSL